MGRKFVIGGEERAQEIADFVASRTQLDLGTSPWTAIGQLDSSGLLVGGCVFNNYTRQDIHGHLAGLGKYWLSRRFLGECFRYIFYQLGCARCTGLVAASNLEAQRFDEGLGFVYEGTLRQYLPGGEDCIIYGMLKSECRWLDVGVKTNGREHATNSTRPAATSTQRTSARPGPVVAGLDVAPRRGH